MNGRVWLCGFKAMSFVDLWHGDVVTLWWSSCSFEALWLCGFVPLRLCGIVALWLCGFVALLLCGSAALWSAPLWLCGPFA